MNRITVPLNEQMLVDVVTNKTQDQFIVDVAKSIEQDESFDIITYCSNLQLNGVFDFDNVDYCHIERLLTDYIECHTVYYIEQLTTTLIDVLLTFKQIEHDNVGLLTDEQVCEYVKTHHDKLADVVQFLDSIVVYYAGCTCKFANEQQLKEQFGVIDNSFIIGPNIVTVFKHIDFIVYYSKIDYAKLRFYPQQFKQVMFGSHSLEQYVFDNNNLLSGYFVTNIINKEH